MGSGRRRKWPWVLLFLGIALVSLFYVGGAWFFSGQVYDDALKAQAYDPASLQKGTIEQVDDTGEVPTVTLLADGEFQDQRKFDEAQMGLQVGDSLLVVGPVSATDGPMQTRPVLDVQGQGPRPGDRYGMLRDVWLTPEQAGLGTHEDIVVASLEGGKFPAWLIAGDDPEKWAVLTHGKGADRSEMLRMARPLHRAGYNVIITTYTNDPGAPRAADGMVHYGRTEWQDIEGAVQYALDEGAQTIVLGGISHGGAVSLGFLQDSPLARRVDGLILDAPASSFGDVIDEAAEYRSLPIGGLPIPESLEEAAKIAVTYRYGVSFPAVDYSGDTGLVSVPLLVFQGGADETVPQPVNDRFMNEGPGQGGTYVVVDGADHVLAWNLDPTAYEAAVAKFLKKKVKADS